MLLDVLEDQSAQPCHSRLVSRPFEFFDHTGGRCAWSDKVTGARPFTVMLFAILVATVFVYGIAKVTDDLRATPLHNEMATVN